MKDGEFFVHLHVGDGAATLACKLRGDVMDVGVAMCAPSDQFSRKRGRIIASGRRDKFLLGRKGARGYTFRVEEYVGESLRDRAVRAFRNYLAVDPVRPLWTQRPAALAVSLWSAR